MKSFLIFLNCQCAFLFPNPLYLHLSQFSQFFCCFEFNNESWLKIFFGMKITSSYHFQIWRFNNQRTHFQNWQIWYKNKQWLFFKKFMMLFILFNIFIINFCIIIMFFAERIWLIEFWYIFMNKDKKMELWILKIWKQTKHKIVKFLKFFHFYSALAFPYFVLFFLDQHYLSLTYWCIIISNKK